MSSPVGFHCRAISRIVDVSEKTILFPDGEAIIEDTCTDLDGHRCIKIKHEHNELGTGHENSTHWINMGLVSMRYYHKYAGDLSAERSTSVGSLGLRYLPPRDPVWTLIYCLDVVDYSPEYANYRHPPVKYSRCSHTDHPNFTGIAPLFSLPDGKGHHFHCTMPARIVGLNEGQTIHPVFEISLKGEHFCPWARLMNVGACEDFAKANSVALRLDWQTEDELWHYVYVQCDARYDFLPRKPDEPQKYNRPYSLDAFETAMGLWRYLNRQHLADSSPNFIDYGIARIQELEHDTSAQFLRIKTDPKPVTPFFSSYNYPLSMVGLCLAEIGLRNVDIRWPQEQFPDVLGEYNELVLPDGNIVFPEMSSAVIVTSRMRRSCDGCRIRDWICNQQFVPLEARTPCDRVQRLGEIRMQPTCGNCVALSRPCSWTNDSILFADTYEASRLRTALHFLPAIGGSAQIMYTPIIEFDIVRGHYIPKAPFLAEADPSGTKNTEHVATLS